MQLDLNLLTVLDALLAEGSVRGAADRLRLSSPAVSRSLGRIRRATGDDILVRTGHTMAPTPYALAIREQVSDLVRQAHTVLAPERRFDLTALERTFTLQAHDTLATALAPPLLSSIAEQAPGVRLRLLAEAAVDTDDLRRGRIDLELGATVADRPEFRSETIGHDRLVVVLRPDHPYAGTLDLHSYAAQSHVLVSRRGRLNDPVDEILDTHGLRRRVLAAVATSAAALHMVSRSTVVMTAPEAMCRPLLEALGLITQPPPIPLPQVPIISTWHQRYDSDPAHAWLREQVRTAVTAAL